MQVDSAENPPVRQLKPWHSTFAEPSNDDKTIKRNSLCAIVQVSYFLQTVRCSTTRPVAAPKETTTHRLHTNTQKVLFTWNSSLDRTVLDTKRTSTHQFRLRFHLILPLVTIWTNVGAVSFQDQWPEPHGAIVPE